MGSGSLIVSDITLMTLADAMPADRDETQFFNDLGSRIAELRKAQNITQVQLAETLGVSQQTVTAYEVGRRRMPVSSLPVIARYLGTTVEELIGEKAPSAKRGPTPKLQQQIERLNTLPKAQQQVVIKMLDGVLGQAGR
jgi:transcriptional regulator with XRE-family HTH domain